MAFLLSVLNHQRTRSAAPEIQAAIGLTARDSVTRRLVGEFPLLDLAAATEHIAAELEGIAGSGMADTAPDGLLDALETLLFERADAVATWLDDSFLLDSRSDAWLRIAAAPILEGAAARVEMPPKQEWTGAACPVCGDAAQVSVIVEESGGFMQGAPRYLVCRRCASWWAFPRATCPWCREDDSRRLSLFVEEEQSWVRIDLCETCRGYVKTFDLRQPEAAAVEPLVDDIDTLTLDLWAQSQGATRTSLSLAGV